MENFLNLVQGNGVEGLVVGFLVLVIVYLLSAGNVVVSGGQKRLANVILSILLAGLSLTNPKEADVIVSAIASVGSALTFEFIQFLAKKQAELKAK